MEFRPSEVAAAAAISAAGEIQAVDTEKAVSALIQHVQKVKHSGPANIDINDIYIFSFHHLIILA